ncbi:PQQ-binding-like beta-propeller repeat protein [Streptomyces sp. NPDC058662]|uniref:outer membrane protein assembly factor BamB family protein n=1 Tax=Streptomyces sp. NPDC058662 TaxID=3346583 RepID=UPI003654309B
MTEPPQPPNQPPTPSGYGHLPGPPPSGYGQPPQGANPYAQQPQQPPYAQQPQQPPYGAPQQPGPGYPPAPPGPPTMPPGAPGAPGRKATVLVAAAVAGVLVLGAGTYFAFFNDGDGKDPAPPVAQSSPPSGAEPSASVDNGDGSGDGGAEADLNSGRKQGEDKVLWLKTSKVDGPGLGVGAKGQWVVGDTVAKTVWKSLVGYAVTDGKEKWKIDFPAEVCGVTGQTTEDGKTVVVVKDGDGDGAVCNQMKMIDLKAGKEGWTKEVPKEGMFDIMTDASPTITGDTVAINRFISTSAFKVSTGDRLFAGSGSEGCKANSYAADKGKMIAVATCQDADSTVEIQDADPATGKKTWSYRLAKGLKVTNVYSVDPIVVDVSDQAKKQRAIVVLGPDGKLRSQVTGEGNFASGCGLGDRDLMTCRPAAVDGDVLYLPTSPEVGVGNEIVAFDLSTGKAKWRTPAGEKRTIRPLKAAGGQLVFYRQAGYDHAGEVLTVPAAGGTPTAVLRHPSGPAAEVENSFFSPLVHYADGRFFLSATRLQAKGKDEKLLMVFGK